MANYQDVQYPWRVGRKVGRTIYVVYGQGEEALVGMMDSRALATEAVEAHNCRVSVAHLALLHNDGSGAGGSMES